MSELVPVLKEGRCEYTDLPTYYQYRGYYISEHFLLASRKLWLRFKDSEPDLTFDKCVEIIIGAQSYRVLLGENAMDIPNLRGNKWYQKLLRRRSWNKMDE